MNGDMLLHEGLWSTAEIDARAHRAWADDGLPAAAGRHAPGRVADADLAICHMETPLAPHGGPYAGYPLFSAPPAIVPALKWVGYDVCTTASNHSIDQGFEGLTRTIDDFERVGIAHSRHRGHAAASRAAAARSTWTESRSALISATYGTNGLPLPDGRSRGRCR